jgi:hypothetical protein
MDAIGDTLQHASITELVKRARGQTYEKRLSKEQEKRTKDIGGLLVPSAFQVPNEVVDEGWLRELNGAEVKILIFIIRKTFGFNKIRGDRIPLSQLVAGTGLSRRAVIDAIKVLEECKLVRVVRGEGANGVKSINFYQLITRFDYNRQR